MQKEYTRKIIELIERAQKTNEEVIDFVSDKFAEAIIQDKVIHTFGTGHSHMIALELFARAGGLGNVDCMLDPDVVPSFGAQRSCAMEKMSGISDIIYDSHKIESGDLMVIISNSGRNAMPIEMAMRAQKEGIYTIAVTNLSQSKEAISRHASGKKLYECADCVIDTCGPLGDSLLTIGDYKTGAASNIVGMYLLDAIVVEAIQKVVAQGKKPYVFQSQNLDGFDNDAIYEHFDGRCKHF